MRDLRKVREQSQVRLTYSQIFALGALTAVGFVLSTLLGYYLGWSAAKVDLAGTEIPEGELIRPDVENGSISKMLALAAEEQAKNDGVLTLHYDELLIGANAKQPDDDGGNEPAEVDDGVVLRGDVTVGSDSEVKEDLVAEAPAKKAAPKKAEAEPKSAKVTKQYTLQVSSFQSDEQAQSLVMTLKERGFQAYKVQAEVNGRIWHRVRVGQYDDKEMARMEVEKLILARPDLRPMVTSP